MARRWLMFGFALAWLTASVWFQSAAQTTAPEEVTKAQALFQAQDYDGAIKTLEEYFQRNPTATTGLLLLVNAYRQKGELDKALAASRSRSFTSGWARPKATSSVGSPAALATWTATRSET